MKHLLLAIVLCLPFAVADSQTTYRSHSSRHSYKARSHSSYKTQGDYCTTCARDSRGHIRRNPAARREFMKEHPCPSTGKTSGRCPGYVVDHVKALKHGGADEPSNMQWQTKAEAKAKDKWE
jgi:hypothetical protein